MDNRFGKIRHTLHSSFGAVDPTPHVGVDNIANYYLSLGGEDMIVKDLSLTVRSVINGPRGTRLKFTIEANSTASSLIDQTGGDLAISLSTSYKYIDTSIRITGVDTGVSLYVPIRYIKLQE